jgi:hypothetical protein
MTSSNKGDKTRRKIKHPAPLNNTTRPIKKSAASIFLKLKRMVLNLKKKRHT